LLLLAVAGAGAAEEESSVFTACALEGLVVLDVGGVAVAATLVGDAAIAGNVDGS